MIVFGLGNPGPQYARTRHNLGFMVVDWLALELKLTFRSFSGYYRTQKRGGSVTLALIKPTVYMNNSGEVVKRITGRSPDNFLVACDDTNLPLGRLRIRKQGSDGGHNGLASVIYQLKNEDFPRLRIGIGPVPIGMTLTEFVLAPFLAEELSVMKEAIPRAADAVLFIARNGVDAAMNRFNQ
jgi:PTH1 family peptidyl-tRNA hydrolase